MLNLKFWKDPVFSKVIAWFIIAILTIIIASTRKYFLKLIGNINNNISIEEGILRLPTHYIIILLTSLLIAIILLIFIKFKSNIKTKELSNNKLGFVKFLEKGTSDLLTYNELIEESKNIKLMFVSASYFLTTFYNELRKSLIKGGDIQLLLASPNSSFVNDINEIENRKDTNGISQEINLSIERLKQLVSEARKESRLPSTGNATEYGFYNTHLRSSLIIIDNKYCFVIPNVPPKRTRESLGFFFNLDNTSDDNPSSYYLYHFDSLFCELKEKNKIYSVRNE
ncbi:MAG: hypothetical protein HOG79_08390 [Prolixibacteraceae bacterium]|jgi:hypothetical protein|nr:hypothetical protein [Prolixibacteraceae bacterium]